MSGVRSTRIRVESVGEQGHIEWIVDGLRGVDPSIPTEQNDIVYLPNLEHFLLLREDAQFDGVYISRDGLPSAFVLNVFNQEANIVADRALRVMFHKN